MIEEQEKEVFEKRIKDKKSREENSINNQKEKKSVEVIEKRREMRYRKRKERVCKEGIVKSIMKEKKGGGQVIST